MLQNFFSRAFSTSPASTSETSLAQRPLIWASVLLVGGAAYYATRGLGGSGQPKGKQALSPKEFLPLKLVEIESRSHNTKRFRFAFESPADHSGMTVASLVMTRFEQEVVDPTTGEKKIEAVMRPYTPITKTDQLGYLDLLIKVYPEGKMTQHLFSMKVGDTLQFKGPFQKIQFEANKWSHIGMLCGGTGLTPMYQVVKRALDDKEDKTKLTLIYANVTEDDILMKKELDQLAKENERFNVYYTLDKAPADWSGFTGYISKEIYDKCGMPKAEDEGAMVFVCGPPGMMNALSGNKNPDKSQGEVSPTSLLGKLGFSSDKVFKF